MSNPLRVSVIINTYNRAPSLQTTLQALYRQNYPHFEVIVVNGPSTDHTVEVLETHSPSIRVGTCSDRNLSVSRNVGIEMARGELVAFLDDDAVPDEDWLRDGVAAFDRGEVGGAGGFVYDHTGYTFQYCYSLSDRLGRTLFTMPAALSEEFCYPDCMQFPYLQGTNAIFRRSALMEIGGFDEEYDYYLDETDVCLRLVDAGYVLKQLSNCFVYHRFLPSHLRQANQVVTHLLPIIKNKVYFALKNKLPGMSYRAMMDEWKRSTDESEAGIQHHIKCKHISADHLDQFRIDADIALQQGMERGFHQPRRLIHSATARQLRGSVAFDVLDPAHRETFKPCPTLLPKSEKLTVCCLSQQYPPGVVEGIGRLTHDIACGLAARGHNIHVLTRSSSGGNTVDFEEGVWVHRLAQDRVEDPAPGGLAVPWHAWQQSARLLRELHRIHEHHPIDIVEGPVWDAEGMAAILDGRFRVVTGLYTPLKKVFETCPELVLSNTPEGRRDFELRLQAETLVAARAHGIRACSQEILDTMRNLYGVEFSPERVAMIPLGMGDRSQNRAPATKGKFIDVLFAGRLEGRKGIDTLLEVVPALCLANPQVRFILVGEDRPLPDGSTRASAFWARHDGAPFRERVVFAGKVPDEELENYLAACDIFVSPSLFESFGLVFLEAMMFSKPVIGCRVGGMKEIIEDGVTGLLAEPNNAESLRAALTSLLEDPAKREAYGRAGRERYLAHYTREHLADRSLALYRRVLSDIQPPELATNAIPHSPCPVNAPEARV